MKKKLLPAILVLVLITALSLFYLSSSKNTDEEQKDETVKNGQTDSAEIVSTKPDPLDNTVIPADQIIEITFNKPLRAPSEFKLRIEPETKHKIELSEDRKTAKIITEKPFELNANYAFIIGAETKFDGIDRWGKEVTYRFQTIKFRGL